MNHIENSQSYVIPPPLFFYQKEIEYDVGSAIVYMKLKMQHQIGPSRFFWWTERLLKSKTQTARLQGIRLNRYLDSPARSNKRWCFNPPMGVFFKKKKKDSPMGVFRSAYISANLYLKFIP